VAGPARARRPVPAVLIRPAAAEGRVRKSVLIWAGRQDGGVQTWAEDGFYEQLEQTGLELTDLAAPGARFLDCRLSSSSISGGDLEGSTWRGGGLSGVRFVGTTLVRSLWQGIELEDCALSGVELFGAQLRKVVVRGGILQGVNLRQTRLQDVLFEDCVLRDVDFGAATLERVRFPGCRIEQVDLSAVKARGVDLRGARITIQRGMDRLRGMVIDHGQLMDLAPALAAELGLEVRAVGDDI
jgi:uncharacterized protein YjbI with pentapeptide repeats